MSAVLKGLKGMHPDPENSLWTYGGDFLGCVLASYGGNGAVCDGQIILTRAASGLSKEVRHDPLTRVKTEVWVQKEDNLYNQGRAKGRAGTVANAVGKEDPILALAHTECPYLPTTVEDSEMFVFVLGYFRSTFHWAEKREGPEKGGKKVAFRHKLQAVDLSQRAFYAHPKRAPPTIEQADVENLIKAATKTCSECGKEYPQVYRCGWTCLNLRNPSDNSPACSAAEKWQDETPDEKKDVLDFRFLAERADFTGLPTVEFIPPTPAEAFRNMTPAQLARIKLADIPSGTSCPICQNSIDWLNTRGFDCDCGRYQVRVPIPIVPLSKTMARHPIHPSDRTPEITVFSKTPTHDVTVHAAYLKCGFMVTPVNILNKGTGRQHDTLYFGVPTRTHAESDHGPDNLFSDSMASISAGEILLERRLMKQAKISGTYTAYATWQAGSQYDYNAHHIAAQEQPPFVEKALQSLSAVAKNILGSEYVEMDAIMLNLYMPGGGINQHHDKDTAGYVMSHSLGADGQFTITVQVVKPGGKKPWVNLVRGKLPHGSIVLMPSGDFQQEFKHEASTDTKFGPRINVSLRAIAKKPTTKRKNNDGSDDDMDDDEPKRKRRKPHAAKGQ